jgi:hypothetical protein
MLFAVLIAVAPAPGTSSPVAVATQSLMIATRELPRAVLGKRYEVALAARGGSGTVRWSRIGELPSWASFHTDTGVIEGTPSADSQGVTQFEVRVEDGAGGSAQVKLELSAVATVDLSPLAITTAELLPAASVNTPYEFQFSASGGVPPYRWSRTDKWPPLDAGVIELSPNGHVANVLFLSEHVHELGVSLADAVGHSAERVFRLPVRRAGEAAVGRQKLRIRTSEQLPTAMAGSEYRLALAAEGGVAPYIWKVVGKLPEGLRFVDGKMEGVVSRGTRAADFVAEVRDSDVMPQRASQKLALRVDERRWWEIFVLAAIGGLYLFVKFVSDWFYLLDRSKLVGEGLELHISSNGMTYTGSPAVEREFVRLNQREPRRTRVIQVLHAAAAGLFLWYMFGNLAGSSAVASAASASAKTEALQ